MHISGNDIHVHDDSRKLKFTQDKASFKKDLEEALKDLEVTDGVVLITGTSGQNLCIGARNGKTFAVLVDDTDLRADLKSFIVGV